MFSPLRRLWTAVFCLLALTSLTPMSYTQNVTTWHNDNNRTGLQPNEPILSTTGPNAVNQTSFGLLWQWPVSGRIYAQPLAVTLQQSVKSCASPCSLIIVATEQNELYAFNAAPSSPTLIWSLPLGNPVQCGALPPGVVYDPCSSGTLGLQVGVTGTPVIDTTAAHPTLYVAAAMQSSPISFDLFAVDITTGLVRGSVPIAGMVPGQSPDPDGKHPNGDCTSDYPGNGTQITFEYHHIQRAALLLLNGIVYVAFSGGLGNQQHGETTNGWMFGYQFNFTSNTFSPTAVFNSTPYGTGGGIWQAGAGPAVDQYGNIYAVTANGTTFDLNSPTIPYDLGDSLLQLDPSTLHVVDFYTPSDAINYPPPTGNGLCRNDEDFGSGGVLVVPSPYTYTCTGGSCTQCTSPGCSVVINADKQSQLYVANRASLGKFNANGGNNIQTIITPPIPQNDPGQGYWGSPAFWTYTNGSTTNYMLYYSVTTQSTSTLVTPKTLNGYQLLTTGPSGPIASTTPTMSTTTVFCYPSPTPSVSWNGTDPTTGIVWVIEKQNKKNVGPSPNCSDTTSFPPAALHAYNATNLSQELYHSDGIGGVQTQIGPATSFSVPTVFNGRVYMGTKMEVDVFGLCSSQQSGCLP